MLSAEKQSLSAKVLKAIVDTQPNKIETLNEEIKTTVISQAIEAAKNQQEGTSKMMKIYPIQLQK